MAKVAISMAGNLCVMAAISAIAGGSAIGVAA
jgi:hypothetical protein